MISEEGVRSMMIRYPDKFGELMDKVRKYYVFVWNEDHTEVLIHQLDPDAPEEIKKAYEEAKRIARETEKKLGLSENWQDYFG